MLEVVGESRSRTAVETHAELALTYLDAGQPERADQALHRGEEIFAELDHPGRLTRTRLLMARGQVDRSNGDFEDAAEALHEAISRHQPGHPSRLRAKGLLAAVELDRGRPIAAQRQIEETVSMLARVQPPPHIRAEIRFVQARVAYAIDGTGRRAALEAIEAWSEQAERGEPEVREINRWLESAKPR
jgi:ATP/maltotriose-dependent transcriptional regulator MalT